MFSALALNDRGQDAYGEKKEATFYEFAFEA